MTETDAIANWTYRQLNPFMMYPMAGRVQAVKPQKMFDIKAAMVRCLGVNNSNIRTQNIVPEA